MLALEYNELKQDATEALGGMWRDFTKRLDTLSLESQEPWAMAWKEYRAGNGKSIGDVTQELLPWQRKAIEQYGSINRFVSEMEHALASLETDVSQAYTAGLQRGRTESDPSDHEWRGCKTAFDRLRLLDKTGYWARKAYPKETLRLSSKERALETWPELFTKQNEIAA